MSAEAQESGKRKSVKSKQKRWLQVRRLYADGRYEYAVDYVLYAFAPPSKTSDDDEISTPSTIKISASKIGVVVASLRLLAGIAVGKRIASSRLERR